MFYCCVPSCKNSNKSCTMFRFPFFDESIFPIWISRIGNESLQQLNPQKVYKNYRICEHHFAPFCIDKRIPKAPLKAGSLPTIGLPGFHDDSKLSNSFYDWVEPTEQSIETVMVTVENSPIPGPTHYLEPTTPSSRNRAPKSRKDLLKRFSLLKSISATRGKKSVNKTQSTQTIKKPLRKVPIKCGINRFIMNSLKKTVSKMAEQDRFCCISFDEVSLSAGLSYNKQYDCIEGFEDLGGKKKLKLANRALVFMASGIRKEWKQPLAFYYVDSGGSSDLVRLLTEVISHSQAAGLTVVATVCDQSAKNKAAISELHRRTAEIYIKKRVKNKNFGFEINNREIIPLYDAPHMIKSIRNNLMKNDVIFKWKTPNFEKASWKVFVSAYESDMPDDLDYRLFYSLSDSHIYEHKMNKTEVILAVQVLSQRVACQIRHITSSAANLLPPEADATANFALFFDKLFDSVNGCIIHPTHGKYLRCAIQKGSGHEEFWREAIPVLESMAFVKSTGKSFSPPSVKSWVHTLKALKHLWENLKGSGFKFLLPRSFNLDGLRNFLSKLTNQGGSYKKPTCYQFADYYNSRIVDDCMGAHSPGANCGDESCEGALVNLSSFISKTQKEVVSSLPKCETLNYGASNILLNQPHRYIAGFVAKKVLKKIGFCARCRSKLILCDENIGVKNSRTYSPKALLRPSTVFSKIFIKYSYNLRVYFEKYCTYDNLSSILRQIYKEEDFIMFTCKRHDVKCLLQTILTKVYIFTGLKKVDKSLKGRDEGLKKIIVGDVRSLARGRYKKI